MSENLFDPIKEQHIKKSLSRIKEEGYPSKRKSTSYDLIHEGVAYPPKYVMSLAGYFANEHFLSHKLFHGGPKKECFKILKELGYKILSKKETNQFQKPKKVNEDIHLKYVNKFIDPSLFKKDLFLEKFKEYYSYAKRSQWLKTREAYKFRFAKWLNDRIDFSSQTDEEILGICRESQNQKFSEDGKGVNFITSALRFKDDFISLSDIKLLRKLKDGQLLEVNDLQDSPMTFPKFSCWAGTLIPEYYRIYANNELTIGLITFFDFENHPITGIKSFNLANTALKLLSGKIHEEFSDELEDLLNIIFSEDYEYHQSYSSWLTQDFILYITRQMKSSENYYWVNQGKQYEEELNTGCVTAPDDNIYHHKKLKELKEGDIVINYANMEIKAVSKVIDEYRIADRPFRPDDRKHIVVDLNYSELENPISISTIQNRLRDNEEALPKKHSPLNSQLGVNQAYLLNFNKDSFNLIFSDQEVKIPEVAETSSNYQFKSMKELNHIMFGPPGTGKTYNTINHALKICGIEIPENRSDAIQEFDKLRKVGRIQFTTFHQSMTYEDFIEGIKPQEPEQDGDPVVFKIEPGIFKKIAIEASYSLAEKNYSSKTANVKNFSAAFDKFKDDIAEKLARNELVELTTKKEGKVLLDSISQQGNFNLKHPGRDLTYTVSKTRLSKLNSGLPDLNEVNNIDSEFREIIGGSNSTVNWAVLNEIRKNYLNGQVSSGKREVSWEEKKEIIQKLKKSDYKDPEALPYVLIIDEINRGNISAIFGELITLIEKDKRLGNKEGLMATLPYSKEDFGVPPNLYILGTMNTADRSVEALDTALRRRFNFIEMPPKSKTIKKGEGAIEIEDIRLDVLLDKINLRVEKLLDKDHMIGHSYFMGLNTIQDLKQVFHNRVFPLLQEYFFGDFGKIELIIGKEFFVEQDEDAELNSIFANSTYQLNGLADRKVYRLKNVKKMDDKEFIDSLKDLIGTSA